MTKTPNPIKPIAESTMTLANQVRRLRNHAAGYDSEAVIAFGRMLHGMEASIDLASLRSLQAADVFDALSDQMRPGEDAATAFAARKIEAFAQHCSDQRQLVEAFRGPAAEGLSPGIDDDLAKLLQLLAEVERQSNKVSAKIVG